MRKKILVLLALAISVQAFALTTPVSEDVKFIGDVRVVGSGLSPVNGAWDYQGLTWGDDGSGGFRVTAIVFKKGGSTGTVVSSDVIHYDSNGNPDTITWTLHKP